MSIQLIKTADWEPVKYRNTFHNAKEGTWWICTAADYIDGICCLSKLVECNYCLKWQNSGLEILQYMCRNQNSAQYNTAAKKGSTALLTPVQHMLTLPLAGDIACLPCDKRFFLTYDYEHSPFVYKLTGNNLVRHQGLCKLTMTRTERSDHDNITLGICDFRSPSAVPKLPDSFVFGMIPAPVSDPGYNLHVSFDDLTVPKHLSFCIAAEKGVNITSVLLEIGDGL